MSHKEYRLAAARPPHPVPVPLPPSRLSGATASRRELGLKHHSDFSGPGFIKCSHHSGLLEHSWALSLARERPVGAVCLLAQKMLQGFIVVPALVQQVGLPPTRETSHRRAGSNPGCSTSDVVPC